MKELIPNEKQLTARIQKAESRIDRSLKTFIDDCIFLGEELIETKKLMGFGNWETFLNRNSSFRFATTRQASKFIRIAENKTLAKTFLTSETSVDGLNKGIADATPEQIAQAKAIEAEQEAKRQQAEAEKQRKTEEKKKEPEIIEGVFTEEKKEIKNPEVKPELTEHEQDAQDYTEEDRLRDDLSALAEEFEDYKVAALTGKLPEHEVQTANELIAELRDTIKTLERNYKAAILSRDTALRELADEKRLCQYQVKRVQKLEKELKAYVTVA